MKTMKPLSLLMVGLTALSFTACTPSSTEVNKEEEQHIFEGKDYTSEIFMTAHGTDLQLSKTEGISFGDWKQPLEWEASILIDPTKQFQEYMGIGAALTDASAETFYKLTPENQELFLKAYYDKEEGIGYNLARTIIHSCDFSSASYTYIEEGDAELKTFDIEHDREFRLPFTKRAIEAAGGTLRMYASPWSPPAFMKTNNDMLQGGKLKPEFRQSWANYYAKFIKAYEKEGVPIWGLTIQNEPMAVQRWESCIYTAEEERDFLKDYLGPTLEKEGLGDRKIIVWDHNRDLLYQRANTILNDPEAKKYVWGAGFHWYEDWKDGKPMFDNVANVKESFPDVNMIFTEGTNEGYSIDLIDIPRLAERYGKSMINDFNNGVVAWTDWNILLDQTGGPNHVGNLCFAPVHGNTMDGSLTFTNSYYYIGHFSKFIEEGAKRIAAVSSSNDVISTAFLNPNGEIIIVAMNLAEEAKDFSITIGSSTAGANLPAHAIETIILNKK